MELRDKIEALLFASGRKMELEEIGKLVKVRDTNIIRDKLFELKKHYEDKNSSIVVMEEGNSWKLTTHEQYIELVRQINPHTELNKTIVETLAVIAWKQPMLQSDVIRIRTNKAYDHISQLMEMGFVVKEKYGRTYLLKLTQKFFEYFDLRNDESLKSLFKDIKEAVVDQKKVGDFNNADNNLIESNTLGNNPVESNALVSNNTENNNTEEPTPNIIITENTLPTETQENNQASKDDDDKKIKEGFSFIFG